MSLAPSIDFEGIATSIDLSTGQPAHLDLVATGGGVLELAPAGAPGAPGAPGPSGGVHTHVQTTPSAEWIIVHPLNRRTVPDLFLDAPYGDPLEPVFTDVAVLPDAATVIVTWPSPVAGRAEF